MVLKYISRPLLFICGVISVILGIIGAVLPVMPTTPFLILAAFLFSKSSPRLHSWLTSLPYFGDAIIDWEQNRIIRKEAKIGAVFMVIMVTGSSIIFAPIHWGLKIMLAAIGMAAIAFVLTRRSEIHPS